MKTSRLNIFKDVKREEALYSSTRNTSLVRNPHKNCTACRNIQMLSVPFMVKFLPAMYVNTLACIIIKQVAQIIAFSFNIPSISMLHIFIVLSIIVSMR
jgi:hypothetical protein